MTRKFYITTAIDYVNSLPHIGTAYEKIGADVIARFRRMEGDEVHFQMGNDEHSINVYKAAEKEGLEPRKYCDRMRREFEKIWKTLGISYDNFIQTSEERHHKSVQELFRRIYDAGDIYRGHYEGWYCESCEAFYTEKDLANGQCPNHKSKPRWVTEENYFFKLSRFQKQLLKYYEDHPEFILPEIRRNEVTRLVEDGLQDISISRSEIPWGIPVPIDEKEIVYVWFDALVNYITAAGFPGDKETFERLWPADVHVIGKDITRFHCVIWPAMLFSAGLPLPKSIFGHGFVYLKGEKMSKTLGNIVTPFDIVPRFGADPLRYYLLAGSSFGSDGDFTWDGFIGRYNADLANNLGNLVSRTIGMATKYQEGKIYPPKGAATDKDKDLRKKAEETIQSVREIMDLSQGDIDTHKALASIWALLASVDRYIDHSAPWALHKEGENDRINDVLYNIVSTIRISAPLLSPFIPQTAEKIWGQLGLDGKASLVRYPELSWEGLPTPLQLTKGEPLFPRIER